MGAGAAEQAGLTISTYIGTDNVKAGGLAADTMAELVSGGKVGVIGGVSGDATSGARVEGFAAEPAAGSSRSRRLRRLGRAKAITRPRI